MIFFYNCRDKFSKTFYINCDIHLFYGRKRILLGLSSFALAPPIISIAQSKIFLLPRSIDSRHLAPIRQVVICVEGIEISIVATETAPRYCETRRDSRLKRRGRIKEKKTFIKEGEDWRAVCTFFSLDERQPLLSIVERVGTLCLSHTERCGETQERRFFSNQHSYARVLYLTVFLPEPRSVFKRRHHFSITRA